MNKVSYEISEIAGIFAADGSMQRSHISFWGNITEDKDYYDFVMRRLFREAFSIEINPHEKRSNRVYGFYICNKQVLSYFQKVLKLKCGNKTYTVRVPKVIMESDDRQIWSSFIRGFSDCDGSLNFDRRYGKCQKVLKVIHTYPRIQLRSVSKGLLLDISKLLHRLEITHSSYIIKSKKINESDSYTIELKGKNRIEKWMDVIGFNNPVHTSRWEIFKKHGFVPIKTSLNERKEILDGRIDPWGYYPKWACSLAWIRRQK